MTTFTTEDRIISEKNGSFTINIEPIPFAGLVDVSAEQGTTEWFKDRLGHITASRITDVLAKSKTGGEAKTRESYKWEIITQRMTGLVEEGYKSSAMEWGTSTEPEARIHYEASNAVFVEQVGFLRHPSIKWVGASPDGLVGEDGGLEIKCPNSTTHLQTIQAGVSPTKYYGQMQMGMWVTGRTWWDFVSYDPRVPKNLRYFCVRVPRDEEYIANMEKEVIKFLEEVEKAVLNLSGEIK